MADSSSSHRRPSSLGKSLEHRSYEIADKLLHYLSLQSETAMEREFCSDSCRSNLRNATESTADVITSRVSNSTEAASLSLCSSTDSDTWDSRSTSISSTCSNSSFTCEPPEMPTIHASEASYESLRSEPQVIPRLTKDKGRSRHSQWPLQGSRADAFEDMPRQSSATTPAARKTSEVRRSRSMTSAVPQKDQVCREALAAYLKEMTQSHVRYEPTEEQKNDPAFAYLLAPLIAIGKPAPSKGNICPEKLHKSGSFSEGSQRSLNVKDAFKRVWGSCKTRMGLIESKPAELCGSALNCKSMQSTRARGLRRAQAKAAAAGDNEALYIIKHRSWHASTFPFGLETIIEVPTQEVHYRRSCCT